MRVEATPLPGLLLLEPRRCEDKRGFFTELHHAERYREHGLDAPFVQDNFSRSRRGTLRGLHYQQPRPQGKLVMVLRGRVWDVAVDVRRGSPTFRRWHGVELDDVRGLQLWIPAGFAHGLLVLSEEADVLYKCTVHYEPACDRAIRWDDPGLGLRWPLDAIGITAPLLSARDAAALSLDEAVLPVYGG